VTGEPVDDHSSVEQPRPDVSRRKRDRLIGSPIARRTLRGTIELLVFLVVFVYFGLLAITNARDALNKLSQVRAELLLVGFGLQLLSLLAYAQLTRAALPRGAIAITTLFRIQLTTKAVTNVVPGGSAAGSAMGYRMITLAGVPGADAGFALVAASVGSAVILNGLLWLTLVVSIPAAGWRPIYVTMALAGVLLLAAFGTLIFMLVRGQQQAERGVRWMARRARVLDEDRMGSLVQRLAARLRELLADPPLMRRVAVWATLNWLLDAASLWVFLLAFDASPRLDSLLVAFCIANISAVIPITPGGLGILDATLVAMLALFGYADAAGLAVPLYRVAQYFLPIPIGFITYLTLRAGPWRIDRTKPLGRLREETADVVRSGESVYDWAERFGRRVRSTSNNGAGAAAGRDDSPTDGIDTAP
jgi:putative heme transporter